MRYRHFQKANADISSIAIGTWAIGGQNYGEVNREDSIRAIRRMVELGVNLIDTAPVYGNGASEMIVGEAIRDIPRESLFLSTKFGIVPDFRSKMRKVASYENVMREVQSSLINLKTDYIDFYFIHYPDEKTNIAQTMTALMELKEKGAIRNIGVSNFSLAQIEQAEAYGEIDVVQPPYSMVNRSFGDLMQACHAKGIDSMTYASLGAGILTGAYRSMPDFAKDDLRWSFYDFYREPKFSKIMDFLSVMDKIASAHHATVAQVAINWSTQKAFVGTALCGVRNVKQAEDNCAAFTWELSADEMRLLDDELDKRGI